MLETLQCVRSRWPIIAVGGTGGAASSIAAQCNLAREKCKIAVTDPTLFEIIQEGNIEARAVHIPYTSRTHPVHVVRRPAALPIEHQRRASNVDRRT